VTTDPVRELRVFDEICGDGAGEIGPHPEAQTVVETAPAGALEILSVTESSGRAASNPGQIEAALMVRVFIEKSESVG
jgi:hypothetical protein